VAPYWDERFRGYGGDKNSYIDHLRLMGYQFTLIPEHFAVHHPHPPSAARKEWSDAENSALQEEMRKLLVQFDKDLKRMYKDTESVLKVCPENFIRALPDPSGERTGYSLPI